MDLHPQAEGLVDRCREDRAVAAVLKGVDQPGGGEQDGEDTLAEGARLGVGLDQGPGGAAAPSGGVQHLLPAGAQHLGVSGAWAGRPLRGRCALPLVLAPPEGRVRGTASSWQPARGRGPASSRNPAGGWRPTGSRGPTRGRGPGPRALPVLVGGRRGPPLLGGLLAPRGCRGRSLCGLGAGGRLRAGRALLIARPRGGVPVNAGRGGVGPPGGRRSRGAGGALGDLGRPRPSGGAGGACVPARACPGPGGRAACPRSPAGRGARCPGRGGLGGDQQTGHEQLQLEAW